MHVEFQASGSRRRRRQAGFTLTELVVVLAILGVLTAIAAPNFRSISLRNRLSTSANDTVAALQVARTEAVRQNRRVMLCPTTTGSNCSGSNWSRFIVFRVGPTISTATPSSVSPAASDDVLREVDMTASGLSVRGSANVAASSRIWFTPDGYAHAGAAATRIGAVWVCSTALRDTQNARVVRVRVSRVSVESAVGGATCTANGDES